MTQKQDSTDTGAVFSRQVSWCEVHLWVAERLADVEDWPMAGSPAWCKLDDTDPAKVAALFDAAQHWALRVETAQEAMCEASRDISAAADWTAIARETVQLNSFYEARPWLRRTEFVDA